MCRVLYVVSERELPLVPFDPACPAFNVDREFHAVERLKKNLRGRHCYAFGASTGCGCGFNAEWSDDEDEIQATKRDIAELAAYLSRHLGAGEEVQAFYCWEGEEHEPPKISLTLHLDELVLVAGSRGIPEKAFLRIVRRPKQPAPRDEL